MEQEQRTLIDEMLEQARIVFYMPELVAIQEALKVPKDKRNNFGNFMYRSASDIIEQAKPHLAKLSCTLITPSITIEYATCHKVRVYAILTNSRGETIYTINETTEEASKKGMDAGQLSGATESYAKKYALGNLFAIDDSKDLDALAPVEEKKSKASKAQPATAPAPEQENINYEEVECAIMCCNTMSELEELWKCNIDYWKNDKTIKAMVNRRKADFQTKNN